MNKTLIRFSKGVLMQIPSMVMDAGRIMQGDVTAWIGVGERVIEAIGDTVIACTYHSAIKKSEKAVNVAEAEIQKKISEAEAEHLRTQSEKLREIREQILQERKRFERRIREAQEETERIRNMEIPREEIDAEIREETGREMEMLQKRTRAKHDRLRAQNEAALLKTKRLQNQRDIAAQTMEVIRRHYAEALDIFDKKIKNNPVWDKLPFEERLRLDEQYRLLQWKYQEQIDL